MNLNEPTVSIVVPAYNAAPFISDALQSIQDQTYRDYEVIVVDDGSTDETAQVVSSFPSVRLLRQKNQGAAAAKNSGISAARGSYVAFLDADDTWMPSKLELQLAFLNDNPELGMAISEHIIVEEDGREWVSDKRLLFEGDPVRNIFLNSVVATPTVVIRRHVFSDVGLFDESLLCAEDENFWMRVGMRYPIGLLQQPLTKVRVRSSSITRQQGVLRRSVQEHLRLLPVKYPALASRLGDAIKVKRAQLHFSCGLEDLTFDDLRTAKRDFSIAVRNQITAKHIAYWLACWFPRPAFQLLRFIRRGAALPIRLIRRLTAPLGANMRHINAQDTTRITSPRR